MMDQRGAMTKIGVFILAKKLCKLCKEFEEIASCEVLRSKGFRNLGLEWYPDAREGEVYKQDEEQLMAARTANTKHSNMVYRLHVNGDLPGWRERVGRLTGKLYEEEQTNRISLKDAVYIKFGNDSHTKEERSEKGLQSSPRHRR